MCLEPRQADEQPDPERPEILWERRLVNMYFHLLSAIYQPNHGEMVLTAVIAFRFHVTHGDDNPVEMLEDFYEHDRYFVKVGLSNQWYLRVISIDRMSNEEELDQLPADL